MQYVERKLYLTISFRLVAQNLTEDATSTGPIHQEVEMSKFTASLKRCSACPAVLGRAHPSFANALTSKMEENGKNAVG